MPDNIYFEFQIFDCRLDRSVFENYRISEAREGARKTLEIVDNDVDLSTFSVLDIVRAKL